MPPKLISSKERFEANSALLTLRKCIFADNFEHILALKTNIDHVIIYFVQVKILKLKISFNPTFFLSFIAYKTLSINSKQGLR